MYTVTLIAAILTILSASAWIFTKREELRSKLKIYTHNILSDDSHCPSFKIDKKRFSWSDIEMGVGLVLNRAQKCKPTAIFGINRGGAIIGGIAAKHLDSPRVNLLDVRPKENKVVEQIRDVEVDPEHIIIFDDSIRRGTHMKKASKHIKENYECEELTRITLLNVTQSNPAPDQESMQIAYSPFSTSRGDAVLPWDRWDG